MKRWLALGRRPNYFNIFFYLEGNHITVWRFPDTTRCPAYNCKMEYGLRSTTIQHYKRKHAKDHIFCGLCDRPVGAKTLSTFVQHYNNIHPTAQLPEYLKEDSSDEVTSISLLHIVQTNPQFDGVYLKILER